MLAQRVASAIVLGPILVLVVAAGGPTVVVALIAGTLVANWELAGLFRHAGHAPLWPFSVALSLYLVLCPVFGLSGTAGAAIALSVILSLTYLVLRQELEGSLINWALTWVAPLYSGLLLSYLGAVRFLPNGDLWLYMVFGVTWGTDIAAYFTGRAIGRRKFFPKISPKKTVEGAIGGLVGGILVGAALAMAFGWDLPRSLGFAAIASVAGEVGDLAESLLKRQVGAKDASNIIPGHGGILDRLDSLLFVGIVAYFWAILIGITA